MRKGVEFGLAVMLAAGSLAAQTPRLAEPRATELRATEPQSTAAAQARLPAEKVTHHQITLADGRVLRFAATAGTVHLTDPQGALQVEIATISYILDDTDPRRRPVTFAINGGPGSASAWLQLGAIGPWRLPMDADAAVPSAAPDIRDNLQTWLDVTDLVFIDPVGTGFSRLAVANDDLRRRAYSVGGDIDILANVIRRWLTSAGRTTSPKMLVGESYGGFRGPQLVRSLASGQGIGIGGLILISPVLDFGNRAGGADPVGYAARLPTMAAVHRRAVDQAAVADVEHYATGEYLTDLMHGPRDVEATRRAADKVAELIGLPPDLVHALGGRVDVETFLREADRGTHRVASAYDATVTGDDPNPLSARSSYADPGVDALLAPVTSAMLDLYAHRLNWLPDQRYELLNGSVNQQWDWGRGLRPPQVVSALREDLALDPRLHVLVEHGLYDLVTPYFANKLLLDQIPTIGRTDRLQLLLHVGGHMFYTREAARVALHDEAASLVGHLVDR